MNKAFMATAISGALLLAACGGTGPQQSAGSAAGGGGDLTMIGYGGDLAQPYEDYLIAPFEESHDGIDVEQIPSESGDFVAQIKASQANSPYDAVPLGESRVVTAIEEGWVRRLDSEEVPNLKQVHPEFKDTCRGYGIPVTYSLIGLAYDSEQVQAPESWSDLWENPEYEGKIGLVSAASNLGFSFFVRAAQLAGGSEQDLEPGFDKIAELEPFTVASSPTSLAQLFERGEIAVAPLWNNDAALLKDKGLPVEFVQPSDGAVVDVTCMTAVENSGSPELTAELVNAAGGAEYQRQAAQAPYFFGPTNRQVDVDESDYLLDDPSGLAELTRIDWDAVASQRTEITERFGQEFGS